MTYFEKLLHHQRLNGKSGLTIPFIIGSKTCIENSVQDSVESLFKNILSQSQSEISLRLCSDLNTLILEFRNPKNKVYFPTHNNQEQTIFSIAIFLKDELGDNMVSVVDNVSTKFNDIIEDKTFSAMPKNYCRKTIWKNYTLEDIQFIKLCLD